MPIPARAPAGTDPLDAVSTRELVREVLLEGRELVQLEVELAKKDVQAELARIKAAAVGFGIALAFAVLALSTLALAAVLALGGTAVVALIFAAGLLVATAIAAALAWAALPKKPLERTVARVKSDVTQLKEHVA